MAITFLEHKTREEASGAAARHVADGLEADIAGDGRASLLVSGGSTPVAMFEQLSRRTIGWPQVTAGLVDERWVSPEDPDSNEGLVRTHLLRGHAGAAGFVPMRTAEANLKKAAAERSLAYAPHCRRASVIVLGMGADGHIASWFPGLAGLSELASPDNPDCVAAVTAPSATVPARMTVTGAAVFNARRVLLLAFGEEKRSLLNAAATADPLKYPVRLAIDGLDERLLVYWAP